MVLTILLFYYFACLGIFSSIMIVLTRNPIFSVLFLILSFFNISALLFLLELEFLPIIFLVVYVGAVAVLFVFVLMMLNTKIAVLKENTAHYLFIVIFLLLIFCFELFIAFHSEFTPLRKQEIHIEFLDELCLTLNSSFEFYSWFCKQSNVFFVGYLLFTTFCYLFVLVGFVLLVAMIGAIVLTLQKTFTSKNQKLFKQVLRRSNESIRYQK